MALCKLNRNLLRSTSCGYNLPEIVDIYVANYEDVSGTTTTATTAGCESLTAITMATGTSFFHIEPAKNSASFEDTLVVEDNGNKYRHAQITFNVTGTYDDCMKATLDAFSLGRYFVVVKTADGNYLGFGRISPLEAETVTLQGGSDTNGIQVILSANVAESPIPLGEAAIATVTGQ